MHDDGEFAVVDDTTTKVLAQTFTAGITGTLDDVFLYIGCCAPVRAPRTKTAYVQYKDGAANVSAEAQDTIQYR